MNATQIPASSSAAQRELRKAATAMWLRYLLARARDLVFVLAAIVVLTFAVVRLVPGDPARLILGPTASAEDVARVRDELGISDSLPHQFLTYVSDLMHGDLGTSFSTGQAVTTVLAQRFPLTAELAVIALLIVLLVGFPLGVAVAIPRGGRPRGSGVPFSASTSVIGAIPEYITGTILILIFPLSLHMFSVQGGGSPAQIILPALAVGLGPAAVFARLVRNETQSVFTQEYMLTATSKRLSNFRLTTRHVFPNVVTSTLTLGGVLLVALLGGTVITENVFNMAGLGTALVSAVRSNDYPVVQGILLLLGLVAVLINLAVDIVLGILDPRVLGAGS